MRIFPKIKQMGERAILLEFEQEICEEVLQKVLSLKNFIEDYNVKEKVEVTNTYNSLLVTYKEAIEDPYSAFTGLEKLFSKANIHYNFNSEIIQVPVCYEEKYGIDLEEISAAKGLSVKQIIEAHSGAEYLVYFTGFLPGFLYLGGLPKELHFPRRKEPRSEVLKGAVGIGEKQTGIYPQKSPGGWNIIGHSPLELFDPRTNPPCPFTAGDRIKFYPVTLEEHREITDKIRNGEFKLKKKINES